MVCVRVTSLRAKNNLFIAKVGHITRETLDCFTSKTKFRLYFSLHSSANATFRCYNIINARGLIGQFCVYYFFKGERCRPEQM